MKKGDYVRLTKLEAVDEPYHPTPSWEEYHEDKDACHSVPSDYIAEGQLATDLEVDRSLAMHRSKRNGITKPGYFRTSYVKKIIDENEFFTVFETINSRYRAERSLPPMGQNAGESEWIN